MARSRQHWPALAYVAALAAVATLGLVIAAVPMRFMVLRRICTSSACAPLQLTAEAGRALAGLGFSASFYAAYADRRRM